MSDAGDAITDKICTALVELAALPVQASDDSSTDRDLRRKQREEATRPVSSWTSKTAPNHAE